MCVREGALKASVEIEDVTLPGPTVKEKRKGEEEEEKQRNQQKGSIEMKEREKEGKVARRKCFAKRWHVHFVFILAPAGRVSIEDYGISSHSLE